MSQEEDEFTLGLFLHGKPIYNFSHRENNKISYYCICCKKVIEKESYFSLEECPNCRLNSVIPLEGKNIFNKLQIEVLRERIILNTLKEFDFEDADDFELED